MKKHILKTGEAMDYPVGDYIVNNISTINAMGEMLLTVIPKKKRINLWCMGSSGAIISGLIANILINGCMSRVKIIHIKKVGESSHEDSSFMCASNSDFNVIVDDFICTGKTIRKIYEKMGEMDCSIDCLCVSSSVELYILRNIKIKHIIAHKIYK